MTQVLDMLEDTVLLPLDRLLRRVDRTVGAWLWQKFPPPMKGEEEMLYVAVDIGCLHCREESHVLGVFTDKQQAKLVCDDAWCRQQAAWLGMHRFQIFPVPDIDARMAVEYVVVKDTEETP